MTVERADGASLVSRAKSGTVWTVVAYAAQQAVRLGSSIVLSKLLLPQHLGLMTLLSTINIGLTLFSDVGLAPSVMRSEKGDDPDYLNTVWTVQAFRGLALWLVSLAGAWPVARFYGNPELLALTPALGLSLVIGGFNSTSLITLVKHMEVRKAALLELVVQLVQLFVTVLIALVHPSVWALVGGRLVSDLSRLALSHVIISGYRNRLAWDQKTVHELLSFGKWIFASTAITFLASQSDRLVLGKLVSMSALGLYGIAFSLADIPRQIITAFAWRVGVPFVSGFVRAPREEFRAVILKYRGPVLLVGAILLAFGVNFADLFLIHVYNKRYHGASWMVPILALGLWHTIMFSTSYPCLIAVGKVIYNIVGFSIAAAVLLLAVPVGFHTWGLPGAVWMISFSDFPVYLSNAVGMSREKLATFRQDAEMTVLFIAVTAGLYYLRVWAGVPWSQPIALK